MVVSLKSHREKVNSLTQQLEAKTREVQLLTVEKDELSLNLTKGTESNIELQKNNTKLQKSVNELESQVQILNEEKQVLDAHNAELEKKFNLMEEQSTLNEERNIGLDTKEKKIDKKLEVANRLLVVLRHDLEKYLEIGRGAIMKVLANPEKLDRFTKEQLKAIFYGLDKTKEGFRNIAMRAKDIKENRTLIYSNIVMRDLVEEVFEELKSIAEYENVELVNAVSKKDIFELDKLQMKVVLRNLIINGIEANEGLNEKGKVEINSVDNDELFFHFYIKNSGHSMTPERLENIFKQEIKSSKGDDRIGEGSILVKNIVKDHKGEIEPQKPQSNEFTTSILLKLPKLPTK